MHKYILVLWGTHEGLFQRHAARTVCARRMPRPTLAKRRAAPISRVELFQRSITMRRAPAHNATSDVMSGLLCTRYTQKR